MPEDDPEPTERAERLPDGGITTDEQDVRMGTDSTTDGVSETEPDSSALVNVVERLPRPGVVVRLAGREARLTGRRGWAIGLTALFALFGLLLATFSGASVAPDGYEPVVASYVELATYLVPLAALAFGHGAIVGAAERGRLGIVLTLPVSRSETALGLFLGRTVVLASAIVVGFGLSGLLLLREFGVAGWPTFAWFLFATIALAVTALAIGVAISALSPTSTMALSASLLVWVWFVLVHDLLALGVLSAVDVASETVGLLIATNPVATYRLLALSPTEAGGAGLTAALDATGLSAGVLVVALASWLLASIGVAAAALRVKRI